MVAGALFGIVSILSILGSLMVFIGGLAAPVPSSSSLITAVGLLVFGLSNAAAANMAFLFQRTADSTARVAELLEKQVSSTPSAPSKVG